MSRPTQATTPRLSPLRRRRDRYTSNLFGKPIACVHPPRDHIFVGFVNARSAREPEEEVPPTSGSRMPIRAVARGEAEVNRSLDPSCD